MTYKEALVLNESKRGFDLTSLTDKQLAYLIDEIPGWEYPLAEDFLSELAKRAGVDMLEYFDQGHGCNDLFALCVERLSIIF